MNKERLQKIAAHLLTGNLGHKTFDFSVFNCGEIIAENGCRTSGCAIGELPIIFPEYWEFTKFMAGAISIKATPSLRSELGCSFNELSDKADFLGLTMLEFEDLFYPDPAWDEDSNQLPETATRQEVAAHILAFIEDNE